MSQSSTYYLGPTHKFIARRVISKFKKFIAQRRLQREEFKRFTSSATCIQKWIRGHLVRIRMKDYMKNQISEKLSMFKELREKFYFKEVSC
jgi:hypothetical protein